MDSVKKQPAVTPNITPHLRTNELKDAKERLGYCSYAHLKINKFPREDEQALKITWIDLSM